MLRTPNFIPSPDLSHESHTCSSNQLLHISTKAADRMSQTFTCQKLNFWGFSPNLVPPESSPPKERTLIVYLFRPKNFGSFLFFLLYPISASSVCSTFKVYPASSLIYLFHYYHLVEGTAIPHMDYCSRLLMGSLLPLLPNYRSLPAATVVLREHKSDPVMP